MDKETPLAFFSPHQAGYSASPDSTRLSLLHPIPEITRAERNILYKRLECAYSNTMKSLRRRLEDERGKNSRLWLEVERERERSRRMSSELEAFRALFVDKNECKRKRIMKSPGSMFRVLDVCMGDKITVRIYPCLCVLCWVMLDLPGSGWVVTEQETEQEGKLVDDSSEFKWWSFSVSLCACGLYQSSSSEGVYI